MTSSPSTLRSLPRAAISALDFCRDPASFSVMGSSFAVSPSKEARFFAVRGGCLPSAVVALVTVVVPTKTGLSLARRVTANPKHSSTSEEDAGNQPHWSSHVTLAKEGHATWGQVLAL